MIERYGHDKIRMVACPIGEDDLRDSLPAVHIAREQGPTDVGLTSFRGGGER